MAGLPGPLAVPARERQERQRQGRETLRPCVDTRRYGVAVTMPEGGQRSAGFVVGSMVAITFGTVFVLVNSAALAAPWPLVIRVTGLLAAALLIVGLVLVIRRGSSVTPVPATG